MRHQEPPQGRDPVIRDSPLVKPEERGANLQPILQLHLAEYQSLTNRITYWITLQYSAIPITGGALLLLAGARDLFPAIFNIWAAAIIVEVGIGAFYYTIYEMMNNAKYIECELAPQVRKLLPSNSFWGYERYRKGNHAYSPTGIYLMAVPALVGPWIALWLHWSRWPPLSWWGDIIGIVISNGIAIWAVILARKGSRAQKELWLCAESEKHQVE